MISDRGSSAIKRLQSYYHLAKPGIIYGNDISLVAGFMLASKTAGFNFWLLLATLVGVSLIIGSACVINNLIDRDIDQFMNRTKRRALVLKSVDVSRAMIYSTILAIAGFTLLSAYTNLTTVILGLIGYIDYIIYTFSKRRTVHSTLIGSIAGATPIAAGYTAVSGNFDMAALWLFLAMLFWQMPHFYAIGIRRLKDYKAAKLPILPAVKGVANTKWQILLYIIAFTISAALLNVYGFTGLVYLTIILIIGTGWLYVGTRGFYTQKDTLWARKMFLVSLIAMVTFSLAIVVDSLLGGKIL